MNASPQPVTVAPTAAASDDTLVAHLAETVIATAAAIDVLSDRVDRLAQQVQQQDCQIFALGEDLKATNAEQRMGSERLDRLTHLLEGLAQNLLTGLSERLEGAD
jgi:hypothetical protein